MARDGTQFVIAVDHVLELMGAGANYVQQSTRSNSFPLLETSFVIEHNLSDDKKISEEENIDNTILDHNEANLEYNAENEKEGALQYQHNQSDLALSIITDNNTLQKSSQTSKNKAITTILSVTDNSAITSSTATIKSHYEVIDIGGGVAVKIVTNEACALTSALKELIKVSFKTKFYVKLNTFLEW